MIFLQKMFLSFLQTSLNVTIIIVLIMAVSILFKNKITTRIKYWLWILVAIRLVIPVIPGMSMDLPKFIKESYEKIIFQNYQSNKDVIDSEEFQINNENMLINNNMSKNNDNSSRINSLQTINNNDTKKNALIIHMLKISSFIWICVGIILYFIFIGSSFIFKRNAEKINYKTRPDIKKIMNDVMKKTGVRKRIPIYVQSQGQSPCIIGIIRPKIYIPRYILENNDVQLPYILLHEVMHYKRRDTLCNFFCVIGICIHWFNPLAWFGINKVKLYMEYACDSSVLELLEENEGIDYGMALINISKMFINKNKCSKIMICFEDKKQIKGRINMIKNFKKGSFKISRMAALSCVVCTVATIVSSVQVKALDFNNISSMENTTMFASESAQQQFLIDAQSKRYTDPYKAQKIAGFNYKFPDYVVNNYEFDERIRVDRISENNNLVNLFFENHNESDRLMSYSISIFKGDPYETIKTKEKLLSEDFYNNVNIDVQREDATVKGINGQVITVNKDYSEFKNENIVMNVSKSVHKYFVWNEDGVYYALNYNSIYTTNQKDNVSTNLSEDDINNIAKSLKDIKDLKIVDYNNEQNNSMEDFAIEIYDKEDLKKAKDAIGFNPKLPVNIKDNIKIDEAVAFKDEDGCLMDMSYEDGDKVIQLTAAKNNKEYDESKKNGFYETKVLNEENDGFISKNIQSDKLTIDNKEVYKSKQTKNFYNSTIYFWKEGEVYYELTFEQYDDEDTDSIAKIFIESKENQ